MPELQLLRMGAQLEREKDRSSRIQCGFALVEQALIERDGCLVSYRKWASKEAYKLEAKEVKRFYTETNPKLAEMMGQFETYFEGVTARHQRVEERIRHFPCRRRYSSP